MFNFIIGFMCIKNNLLEISQVVDVFIQSYSEWNKCVITCENVVIKSKTKSIQT